MKDKLQSIHDEAQATFYKEKLGENYTTIITNPELQRVHKYTIVETKRDWTDYLCELGARPLIPREISLSKFYIWDFIGGTGWWKVPDEVAIKCLTLGHFPIYEKKIVNETV